MAYYSEVGLTEDELKKQKQIEEDHALAMRLQQEMGGGVQPPAPVVRNPPVQPVRVPVQPVRAPVQPVRTPPVAATPDKKKKKKKKDSKEADTSNIGEWGKAHVDKSRENEFVGWEFRPAPPDWK